MLTVRKSTAEAALRLATSISGTPSSTRVPLPGVPSPPDASASAVVRARYHLYQGFGPALGNLVMGLVFVWLYRRGGRLMPLLIAHALLDTVGVLAPQLLAG